ncbi:hypothetical protein RKD28_001040 [Streptomyces sp. SAI-229]
MPIGGVVAAARAADIVAGRNLAPAPYNAAGPAARCAVRP